MRSATATRRAIVFLASFSLACLAWGLFFASFRGLLGIPAWVRSIWPRPVTAEVTVWDALLLTLAFTGFLVVFALILSRVTIVGGRRRDERK